MKKSLLPILLFSLALLGCSANQPEIRAELNQNALPVGALPENPLQWQPITSTLDTKNSTMSTLYGNDLAVQYARTHSQHDYPDGAILSFVTWSQREDSRWYGAHIPDHVQSVEFLYVHQPSADKPSYSYVKYSGSPLTKQPDAEVSISNDRAQFLLSLRAAVMP